MLGTQSGSIWAQLAVAEPSTLVPPTERHRPVGVEGADPGP